EHEEPVSVSGGAERRRQLFVWGSGVSLAIGLAASTRPLAVADVFFGLSIALGLLAIGRRTLAALRSRTLDINVLMVIAVAGAGQSAVNQAPITGESLPVEKAAGDPLFAGTINGRGALEMRVTRLRRDTTLARIIHLVERAQAQRAPAQALVERFARFYTPAVIALAIAVALVPPLALHLSWTAWIYRALVLLVVSCPCALVISTPVSIVAA